MLKKMLKWSKFLISIVLICSLLIPSYAALSASDGSAFVTKAEFDSALADFNARLTTFEAGINSKIDSQVTSYLDRNGIWNGAVQTLSRVSFDGCAACIGSYNGAKARSTLWKEWNTTTAKGIQTMTRTNDYVPSTTKNLGYVGATIGNVENTSGWYAFNQTTTWLDCYNIQKDVTRFSTADTFDPKIGIWFKSNKSGLCFVNGTLRQGLGKGNTDTTGAGSFTEIGYAYTWNGFTNYGPSISAALGFGLYMDEYLDDNFKRSDKVSSNLINYVYQSLNPNNLGVEIHNYTQNVFGVGKYLQIPTYDRPIYGQTFVKKDRYYILNPATWTYDYANRVVWVGLVTSGFSTDSLSLNMFKLSNFAATVY